MNHNIMDDSSRTVESVEKACEILSFLSRMGSAGVTEIAEEIGRSKGSVHTHLFTLQQYGYVAKLEPEGKYRIGSRIIHDADHAKQNIIPYYSVTLDHLKRLAENTGETSHLVIEENGWGFCILQCESNSAEKVTQGPKNQYPLHATASGKVILAWMPRERRNEILNQMNLVAITDHTLTEKKALIKELQLIRNQGYSLNDQESRIGMRAVAAPIKDGENRKSCAICVTGPISRIHGDRYRSILPRQILETTTNISLSTDEGGENRNLSNQPI